MRIDEFVPQVFTAVATVNPGATPQDVMTIAGNTTTNVYVLKMGMSNTQTTAGINIWYIAKRNTANVGGTHSAVTIASFNSNYTPHATVLQYTANPTGGNYVGDVWGGLVNTPAPATAGIGGFQGVEVDFQTMLGQPVALLGPNEVLAWNFNGEALPTGLGIIAYITWVEFSKT